MKASSEDLRKRVVDAVEQGYPRTEIIKRLGVSRATIKGSLKQDREIGHVKGKPLPGRSPKKLAALQAGIVEQLRAYPDVSVERHCKVWEQTHGVRVSRWTMSEAVPTGGVDAKKKSLAASERNEQERENGRQQMSQQKVTRRVFLDECGSTSALTPLSARAPKGERAHGSVPRNRGKNMMLIAAFC